MEGGNKMKAIRYEAYGTPEVMSCVEIDKPVCGAKEILVKVMAHFMSRKSAGKIIIQIGTTPKEG